MNSVYEQLRERPILLAGISVVVGFLLGVFWGWVVQPVEWVDATPSFLRADLQEDYLRMTIESFQVNNDQDLALQRWSVLGPTANQQLLNIQNNPGGMEIGAILAFSQLVEATGGFSPDEAPPPATTGGSPWTGALIGGSIVLVVTVIGAAFFYLFRNMRPGVATPAMQARELSRQAERTDFEALGQEPPIAQYVTSYVLGDDLFDDSFSIDSPSGEFLGECGVSISEPIGVGEPKKVTAFEVWIFDKNDIQTVTKVLMSAHAFNDLNMRQRLAAKGEPVLMEPQKQVILETATLQMVATLTDMEYGEGALPATSFVDRLTLELAIWVKG